MHLNPDHFLQTPQGRVISPERNAWAWRRCFEELPGALENAGKQGRLFVLVGAQGSGKSTWAGKRKQVEPECVIFDAILVKRLERAPILSEAAKFGVPAVAVWFQMPLEICLARNAMRPPDEVADEDGLRNVYAALEPPTRQEGFASIWLIRSSDA